MATTDANTTGSEGFFDYLVRKGGEVVDRYFDIEFKEDELDLASKYGLIQTNTPQGTVATVTQAQTAPGGTMQPGLDTKTLLLIGGGLALVLLLAR